VLSLPSEWRLRYSDGGPTTSTPNRCASTVVLSTSLFCAGGRSMSRWHARLLKELLEAHRRDEYERPRPTFLHGESMGHSARKEDKIPRPGRELLLPASTAQLARQDVQGFILATVEVEEKGEARGEVRFDDTEGPCGLLGTGLDRHQGAFIPDGPLVRADVEDTAAHGDVSVLVRATGLNRAGASRRRVETGSAGPGSGSSAVRGKRLRLECVGAAVDPGDFHQAGDGFSPRPITLPLCHHCYPCHRAAWTGANGNRT